MIDSVGLTVSVDIRNVCRLSAVDMSIPAQDATHVQPQKLSVRWLRLSEQIFRLISGAPAGFKPPRSAEAG
jgi:hypothetical protein